jgi:DUF4097 and DUF4098 domain-containing protein YvlB
MKKVSRIAIAAGFLLVLIAFVWSGFSWHNIATDFQNINRKNFTNRQATFDSSSVQNIDVNMSNVDAIIETRTNSNHVTVDYSESKAEKYTVSDSDGTISVVSQNIVGSNFCLFECISSPTAVTIYVPANSTYAYDLTASNAAVHFDNTSRLHTQAVHISASNSNVTIQDIAASDTMSVTNNNGSIWLRDVTTSGKLSLGSSNANNTLLDVRAPNITSGSANGSTTLNSVATTSLTANSSNANITLDHLSANQISLTSNNGGISGTIVGSKADFNSEITSDNGSLKINNAKYNDVYFSTDNGPSAKSLTARASNSAIDIQFVR